MELIDPVLDIDLTIMSSALKIPEDFLNSFLRFAQIFALENGVVLNVAWRTAKEKTGTGAIIFPPF